MTDLILIAPKHYKISDLILRVGNTLITKDQGELGYLLEDPYNGHAFLEQDNFAKDNYEDIDLEFIQKIIPEPSFYKLSSSNAELLNKIAAEITNDDRILVDDDQGHIVPGNEFHRTSQK